MFIVNQNVPDIDPGKSLFVEVSGEATGQGLSAIIYGYNNGHLEFLVQGDASESVLEIPNLKVYYDAGIRQFLVVVVNSNGIPPYDGESNIYTTVKLSDETDQVPTVLKSNRCKVQININGRMKEVTDTKTTEYDLDLGAGFHAAVGAFSGNTFTGNWNINLDPLYYTGTVTVILNKDHTMASSVTWSEDHSSYNSEGTLDFKSTYSFTRKNLLLYSDLTPGVFQITGTSTCDPSLSVTYSAFNYASSANISLEKFSCDPFSYVTISFWEE
ncbi:hypothetical protein JW935_23540 [candidate division KSB1 bacterium]|nr:hypothetical protein [candidate division KSB1 bacterium]